MLRLLQLRLGRRRENACLDGGHIVGDLLLDLPQATARPLLLRAVGPSALGHQLEHFLLVDGEALVREQVLPNGPEEHGLDQFAARHDGVVAIRSTGVVLVVRAPCG